MNISTRLESEISQIIFNHIMEIKSEFSSKSNCSYLDSTACFGISKDEINSIENTLRNDDDAVKSISEFFLNNDLKNFKQEASLSSIISALGNGYANEDNTNSTYRLFSY